MNRNNLSIVAALLLTTACGGGGTNSASSSPPPIPTITPAPPQMAQFSPWYPGPVINGKNYSPNTILTETAPTNGLTVINIPHQGNGETDAVLMTRTINGAKSLHLKYMVETDSTVEPKEYPQYTQASIALFFQRANDDWSCKGKYEAYRWYATKYRQPLAAGTYTMDVPLDDGWTGCQTSTIENNPGGFSDAKQNSTVVGLALGGGTGVMHGVVGLGSYTRITILEWAIK